MKIVPSIILICILLLPEIAAISIGISPGRVRFYNLLENAARHTPLGSKIDISARIDGRRIEIRIADNGPGLPPGSEARVFEKFYRASTSTADGRRGVGLGLAICQGIVQAHGGRIRAENRPNGGAEFVISLPCDEKAPRVKLDEVPALGAS